MISYFEAPYTQRGSGFGGIFRGLARFMSPIAATFKKVINNPTVKNMAKEAVKAGVSLGADALEGRDVKESAKKKLASARKRVANTMRSYGGDESDEESEAESIPEMPIKKRKLTKRKINIISSKINKKRKTIFDD